MAVNSPWHLLVDSFWQGELPPTEAKKRSSVMALLKAALDPCRE
jgi:hypothetical protein